MTTLNLDNYLSIKVNVTPIVNEVREHGSTLFACTQGKMLTMFMGLTKDIELKVLHNNLFACGFMGVQTNVDVYPCITSDGSWRRLDNVTVIHLYVKNAEDYDAETYRRKMLYMLMTYKSNLVIEVPADPNSDLPMTSQHSAVIHPKYHSFAQFLEYNGFSFVGVGEHKNLVYYKESR